MPGTQFAQTMSAETLARRLMREILETALKSWDLVLNLKCARLVNLINSDPVVLGAVVPVFCDLRAGTGTRLFAYRPQTRGEGSGGHAYVENSYSLVVAQPGRPEFHFPGLGPEQKPISGSELLRFPVIARHNGRLNKTKPRYLARCFQLVLPAGVGVDAGTVPTPRLTMSDSEPGATPANPISPPELDSLTSLDDWAFQVFDQHLYGGTKETVSTTLTAPGVPNNDPVPPQPLGRALSVPSIVPDDNNSSSSSTTTTATMPSPRTISSSSFAPSPSPPRTTAVPPSPTVSLAVPTLASSHAPLPPTIGSDDQGAGGGCFSSSNPGVGANTQPAVSRQELEVSFQALSEHFEHGDEERRRQILRDLRTAVGQPRADESHNKRGSGGGGDDVDVDALKRSRCRGIASSSRRGAEGKKEEEEAELKALFKQIRCMVLGEHPPPPRSSSTSPSSSVLPHRDIETAEAPASSLEMMRHLEYVLTTTSRNKEAPATTPPATTTSSPLKPTSLEGNCSSNVSSAFSSGELARLANRSSAAASVGEDEMARFIERINLSREKIEASSTESISEMWEKLKANHSTSLGGTGRN